MKALPVHALHLLLAFGLFWLAIAVPLLRDHHDKQVSRMCHRWYSAAATARDSLWIVTLRPECQP